MFHLHNLNKMCLFITIILSIIVISSDGYVVVNQPTLWQQADAACQQQYGTRLASIHSRSDQNAIQKLCDKTVTNGRTMCWIGGSHTLNPCVYSWVDGTPFDESVLTRVTRTNEYCTGDRYSCIVPHSVAVNPAWHQLAPGLHECHGHNEHWYPICNAPQSQCGCADKCGCECNPCKQMVPSCGESPCRKFRRAQRRRRRRRRRRRARKRRKRRMRRKWRRRMSRLKLIRRFNKKIRRAMRKLRKKESHASSNYGWIADALSRRIMLNMILA